MTEPAGSFGDLLRSLRQRAGLTQEELAERAGLSAKAISALERGERTHPRPHTVRALARALELPEPEHERLLGGAGHHPPPAPVWPLEALPVDELPVPGPLAQGSRMPFPPSPLFVGRAPHLRTIAAALRSGVWAARPGQTVAVSGIGGVGKTQLAVEFVHRYGRYFPGGVLWLGFASPDEVPLEVAACGGPSFLDLRDDFASLGLDDQVALVRRAWQSDLPRLLVFDNCEEEALLAAWRPSSGGGRVLVTSRRSSWDPALGVECLTVDVMAREESVDLLRRFRPDIPGADLSAIAAEVGDLPLALHLAGSFLHRYRADVGPREYLAQLREPGVIEHASLLGRGLTPETSPTGHVQSVAQTFAMSCGRLDADDDVDRVATALLARAARLAPGEPMPRDLLLETLGEPDRLDARLRRSDALERLAALGLVTASADRLRLHRLVAHVVAGEGLDPAAGTAVEEALIAAGRRARRRELSGTALLALVTHLRHVATSGEERDDTRTAAIWAALGAALWAAGDFAAARPPLERAHAIRERCLGPDHPDTAGGLHDLAQVLFDESDLAGARRLYERIVAIRERTPGEDDVRTAEAVNDLAAVLRAQGELAAARPLFERALAILERTAGPDHPDTAISLNDLALLLRDLGELDAGRPLLERAVAIRTRALGADHPETADSINNLGALLRARGDSSAALELFRRALSIRQRVLGPDHPHTAQSINNVAGPLQDQGRLDAAREHHERALAIRERVLGPDHPDTGASLNNLARVLREQGEISAALPLQNRAVRVFEESVGPHHPNTARALHNLAVILRLRGEVDEARATFERALAISERVLGPGHPQTAQSRESLEALRGEPAR